MTDPADELTTMDCDLLRSEVKRLSEEQPRIAQWTESDQHRLVAYREVLRLCSALNAAKNRINDDRDIVNELCRRRSETNG
jgi:hypothetical protein